MKVFSLFVLLLLQSCFYELPPAGRVQPKTPEVSDTPVVVVNHYYPNPIPLETHTINNQIDEVVSDATDEYHDQENKDPTSNDPEKFIIEVIIVAPVETAPILISPPETSAPASVIVSQEPISETTLPNPELTLTPAIVEATPASTSPMATNPIEISPVIEENLFLADQVPETLPIAETPPAFITAPINTPENVVDEPMYPVIPLVNSTLIPNETKNIVSLFVFYASLFRRNVDYYNLIIEIEENPSRAYIAYCSRVNNNKNPKVRINRQFWKGLTSIYREQLLFHELGHCLLNRSHQGNNFYNPNSIMNSSLFSDTIYQNSYDYFIKELFAGFYVDMQEPLLFGALYDQIH